MIKHKIQRKRENDHEIKDINASLELGVEGWAWLSVNAPLGLVSVPGHLLFARMCLASARPLGVGVGGRGGSGLVPYLCIITVALALSTCGH